MPIKTLQQAQAQVGRIRIGHQVPTGNGTRKRPEKLDRFRFTTPSRALADAVAARYGGEVAPWQPEGRPAEFEVISTARVLPVLVPPRPVTQWYEMWSGAGCQRRCDGEIEQISGDACLCPLDPGERAQLAAGGKACKATTRLKVMLPEIPGIGVWRIDSHGYYAAIELPQTAEFLGAVTEANGYIKARLELQEREVRRPGEGLRRFMVPVLHVDATPLALMGGDGVISIAGGQRAAIGGPAPAAIEAGPNVQQEADRIRAAALAATTSDELRALWDQAKAVPVPDELRVGNRNGEPVTLYELLVTRASEIAAPADLPGDRDELIGRLVVTAADVAPDADWAAEFLAQYGIAVDDAPVEVLQAALRELMGRAGEASSVAS